MPQITGGVCVGRQWKREWECSRNRRGRHREICRYHEALPLKILQLVLLKTKRLTNIIITQYLHQEILHEYKFSNIQSTFRYPQYLYGILFSLAIFFFSFYPGQNEGSWVTFFTTVFFSSKSGIKVQNEAMQRLTELCQENVPVIANALFQQHKR